MNVSEISAEIAREQLEDLGYGRKWMQFEAWDGGSCRFWADADGDVAAYVRFDDRDARGISFFEVRDKGNGLGSQLIRQLQAEIPGLYVSGEIDNQDCARFWARMGYDVTGVQVVRE